MFLKSVIRSEENHTQQQIVLIFNVTRAMCCTLCVCMCVCRPIVDTHHVQQICFFLPSEPAIRQSQRNTSNTMLQNNPQGCCCYIQSDAAADGEENNNTFLQLEHCCLVNTVFHIGLRFWAGEVGR